VNETRSHLYQRLESATSDLDPPFAVVDMEALWANAADMTRRAGGKPIRLASKSVRCRALQEKVLTRDGFRGTLAFTLPEALWLVSHGFDDIVVAYPTVHRGALSALSQALQERPDLRVTIMVDTIEQLDLIDAATGERTTPLRICMDVDAGLWLLGGKVRIGAKRSPIHTSEQAVSLAREISRRDGFTLVGVMAYEAQIAGVGDALPGHPLRSLAVRAMQSRSAGELHGRRAEIIHAIQKISPLEFVNGGGTGSLEGTSREDVVTEIGAGSGLYGPALFDAYRRFSPRAAAMFALPVVRRSRAGSVTVLGGGYLASGPADEARLPQPFLPEGLRLDKQEGAGEVQTPLLGGGTDDLDVGGRVYFRHAKAGEMCERFDRLYLIEGDGIAEVLPTYRGEGRSFL
jgi:D-serine deaminase-like pyridoxal phosphate-dependent protein